MLNIRVEDLLLYYLFIIIQRGIAFNSTCSLRRPTVTKVYLCVSTNTSRSRLGTHSFSKLNGRSYHFYITPFGNMKEITIKL